MGQKTETIQNTVTARAKNEMTVAMKHRIWKIWSSWKIYIWSGLLANMAVSLWMAGAEE